MLRSVGAALGLFCENETALPYRGGRIGNFAPGSLGIASQGLPMTEKVLKHHPAL